VPEMFDISNFQPLTKNYSFLKRRFRAILLKAI
jgi:hypothetical protein